jgi:RimJ/RimL family protein N-acetyltransferase
MANFNPGKIIRTIKTKDGREGTIRYPKWEDLDMMTAFINTISKEDIFVTFSGETIYKDGEMYYISEMFKSMELENSIYLACFVDGKMAGSCTVLRDVSSRKRSYHVGIFGITIGKEFRGQGIGEQLAMITMEEAKKEIPGLKMFILNVYSENKKAQALYKKLGFSECGRTPKSVWYKGDYIDEIKMFLPITIFI